MKINIILILYILKYIIFVFKYHLIIKYHSNRYNCTWCINLDHKSTDCLHSNRSHRIPLFSNAVVVVY